MRQAARNGLLRGLGSLHIKDFRGWVGEHTIDTDAEIVLLTGSNGCGKTSLLDTVNLLVNGHFFDLRGEDGSESQRLEDLVYDDRAGFVVTAIPRSTDQPLSVHFERGNEQHTRDDGYWSGLLRELNPPPPELLAAATTYFQDRIDFILRDLDRGTTLRDFLAPLPAVVSNMRERLERLPDQLRRDADYVEAQLKLDHQPGEVFRENAAAFRETWDSFCRREPWLGLFAIPEDLDLLESNLSAALMDWLEKKAPPPEDLASFGRLLDETVERIHQRLRERRRGERDSARSRLEDEATALRDRLSDLDHRYPTETTNRVLAQFAAEGEPGLPNLWEVLHSIEVHLPRWRELSPGLPGKEVLTPVLEELSRLAVGAAGVLRASLGTWLAPWVAAARDRAALVQRLQEIEEQLGRAKAEAGTAELARAIDAWRRTWNDEIERRRRLVRAERTRAEIAARRRMADTLEEVRRSAFAALQPLDDAVTRDLAKALDGTLVRFQFDTGFLPVRPQAASRGDSTVQGYRLYTCDKRPSYVLSTGQKGQVALAYMLAQALLLRELLPHRVLVLDDTSTAFDLGNIVRQATWLRQLAYSGQPDHRWQIFVASHHEELTNRLTELLVPPEGCEMRLIRFRGWTPDRGPEIELRKSRSNPPVDEALLGRLSDKLERSWSTWHVRRAQNV